MRWQMSWAPRPVFARRPRARPGRACARPWSACPAGVVLNPEESGEGAHRPLGFTNQLVEAQNEDEVGVALLGIDHLPRGTLPELEERLGICVGIPPLGRGEPAQRIAKDRNQAPVG